MGTGDALTFSFIAVAPLAVVGWWTGHGVEPTVAIVTAIYAATWVIVRNLKARGNA